ncbi:MAG: hypothetical protein U0X40_04400 [Ferruginibacter sp.]
MNRYNYWMLLLVCLLAGKFSSAQNSIAPFSGLRYFQEGISIKTAIVKIDGSMVLSNRISVNKETAISLEQAAGFTMGPDKLVFAGAEFSVVSVKGEVLYTNPDLLAKTAAAGMQAKDLSASGIRFTLTPDMLKANPYVTLKFRVFDRKSKNQLRMEFPVTIARPGEALLVTKTAKSAPAPSTVNNLLSNVNIAGMKLGFDSSIKVNPKMLYASLDLTGIEGVNMVGILNGVENFWVYDRNLNETRIPDILLKNVGGSLEGGKINYTLKIPFRAKTAATSGYIVRFRWESGDKRQIIDIVFSI